MAADFVPCTTLWWVGIDRAPVTCAVDNTGSRTVIERNGGIPAEPTADRLRFWIPTSPNGG